MKFCSFLLGLSIYRSNTQCRWCINCRCLLSSSCFYSLKSSFLWWAKAPGLKYCQIPRGSTSVSFFHSFLTTKLQSRTAASATYSTTETFILEIPFILHKNYSEVIHSFTDWHKTIWCLLSEFLKHFLIMTLIISTQMVTSILRWLSTDSCVPSPRGSDSCTPFSSITTDCWNRFLSPERYFCKRFKYKAHNLFLVGLKVSSCCRSCWSLQFTMVWIFHQKESYPTRLMLKCGSRGSEDD